MVVADAPLEVIPVFVRAGSILPMTQVMQFVDQVPDAAYEIRVYCGADAEFTLYEDAGDGYEYENGACAFVKVLWSEARGELTLSARQGGFPELVKERDYSIVFISECGREVQAVRYTGEKRYCNKPSREAMMALHWRRTSNMRKIRFITRRHGGSGWFRGYFDLSGARSTESC